MNIRFYNARILTMEENREIFNGEVWIQNEHIVYVGDTLNTTGTQNVEKVYSPNNTIEFQTDESRKHIHWDKEIDCHGNLLMPGFKDVHTHSGMTLLRSFADDMPLHDWLNYQIFPVEAKMTGEDIYALTKLAILEYLTSGITAIGDMYLTPHTIARACDEMGMRCAIIGTLNNFAQSIELLEECCLTYNANGSSPLLSYIPGIHAEYTCSKELLEQTAELAHKYKVPVFTHLSETKKEVTECRKRYGMSPVAFLSKIGLFDYGGAGHHCVYVDEEDMRLLAEKKVSAVTNPASNMKLASGIASVSDLVKAGVNVAIGTDGPASNNCLDMFREMFLVTGLAKIREEDASAMKAGEVLKMATVNGAKALYLNESDILAAGKLADIIMLDLHQPNMQPLNHIADNIVYSGSKQNVKMTMIHGRILYENGIFHVGEEPEDIYAEVKEIQERIMKEL